MAKPSNLSGQGSTMVGVRIDPKMRERLEKEQVRRINSGHPPSERTLSDICRDALVEYLNKQEILN